jgi:hypothetical protein
MRDRSLGKARQANILIEVNNIISSKSIGNHRLLVIGGQLKDEV